MAHFFGRVDGRAKTPARRLGTKKGGLSTIAASWEGAVEVRLWHDDGKGKDMAEVELRPWFNKGIKKPLYKGPVGGGDG